MNEPLPVLDAVTLFIFERTDDNHDQIDKRPNPEEASERHNCQDACTNLADIKPMHTEHAQKKATQQRRQLGLR